MTGGYVVNDAPDAGPATPTHPGAGQDAAVGWLNRLKALAQRMCVAPTTYAQADLDALQRVGDPGLSAIATNGAADIVDQILGVAVDPRRHPGRRRAADRSRGSAAVGAGPDGRDRRRRMSPQQDSATGEPATADVAAGAVHAAPGRRAVRPDGRRRAGGRGHRSVRRRRIWTRRWTSRSNTIRRWRAARTRWARCCGAACTPTPSRAPRS